MKKVINLHEIERFFTKTIITQNLGASQLFHVKDRLEFLGKIVQIVPKTIIFFQ